MNTKAPDWLSSFQSYWSIVMRRPLEVRDGYLSSSYQMAGARAYQEQYWYRLFQTLHQSYPLLCRLLGYWDFNHVLTQYLEAYPSQGFDLGKVGTSLPLFLQDAELHGALNEKREALIQAALIDHAFDRCFLAPPITSWQAKSADELSASRQLVPNSHWDIVEDAWELIRLRELPFSEGDPPQLPCIVRQDKVKYILILRGERCLEAHELSPVQARLYKDLRHKNLGDSLARLEAGASELPQEDLPRLLQSWLATSIDWSLWAKSISSALFEPSIAHTLEEHIITEDMRA